MKTTLVEVMENGSEDKFDAQSHSATVFYSGFGGGGSSSPSGMGVEVSVQVARVVWALEVEALLIILDQIIWVA